MFKPRACGCKGIRTCLRCEEEFGLKKDSNFALSSLEVENCFEFCHLCGEKAWKGTRVYKDHPSHDEAEGIEYPGVLLIPNFLTKEEEQYLVGGCDGMDWDLSQSGRRKQNFGPKTNFKKMKINGKGFSGFPKFSEFAQRKMRRVPLLSDFQTIEQCAIEYRPETGACIDPHIDDCWVWGERVISLSLISDSVLTMTKYRGGREKYNLQFHYDHNPNLTESSDREWPIVRIPMPARSLLVLYGPARYEWEHSILRSDVTDRRICLAYREFTKEYLPGGMLYEDIGREICDKANNFVTTQDGDGAEC